MKQKKCASKHEGTRLDPSFIKRDSKVNHFDKENKRTLSAIFRRVYRQNKNQIEVNPTLECPVNQQNNTYHLPRFFIEEKAATNLATFSYLSQEYKKIQVVISDLKISKKQAK